MTNSAWSVSTFKQLVSEWKQLRQSATKVHDILKDAGFKA